MAAPQLTVVRDPALPSFWPSLTSASAQIQRRQRSRAGRVQSGFPAAIGRTASAPVRDRRIDRSSRGAEHSSNGVSGLGVSSELRYALEADQLLLHYQPQSDLVTGRIRGVEALIRWEHPDQGLLPAGNFINDIEDSGVAGELRRFVLETSGSQWCEWNALGFELDLAVNLSPVDMHDAALSDEIEDLIDRYGIPPENLILEITERTLIYDERRASLVLDRLAGLGVRLAIDDFGTGYSSLASLRTFPIQQIKLHPSVLAEVPGDAAAEAIIGGSIEIAHGVGASVVAEGVETWDQFRFVSFMGCDVAQGFLIGRPVRAGELSRLLDAPRLSLVPTPVSLMPTPA
jgi:EAL domain-containing protein (putative c-di-GMP-specific phosphodiesterase class I)